jgi:large subunit ribosomal protein L23
MNANQIIRRPLVTEKSTMLRDKLREKSKKEVIAFEVDVKANKIQVKNAVEQLFKVKVEEVRLFNVRGKVKRMGRYAGKRRDWRKAYVRLKEGEKAPDFIEGS